MGVGGKSLASDGRIASEMDDPVLANWSDDRWVKGAEWTRRNLQRLLALHCMLIEKICS